MKLHANARLSLKGRELLVDRVEVAGWSLMQAAEAAGVSDRTAREWLGRFRGSLMGRPLPPHGVTLELQACQPGRGWRTVKTARTAFRMRLRPSDGYPYSRGTSKNVRVRDG